MLILLDLSHNENFTVMKQHLTILILSLFVQISFGQTYANLYQLDETKVYYSSDAKERAVKILDNVAKAEHFFQSEFNVNADFTLLVVSPGDWKTYAHPNAIYGIPHFLPDGRLVVVAENNDFWKRNTPTIDKIPPNFLISLYFHRLL